MAALSGLNAVQIGGVWPTDPLLHTGHSPPPASGPDPTVDPRLIASARIYRQRSFNRCNFAL